MSVFTEDFRLTSIRPNQEIPTGMDAALYKAVGRYRSRGSIAKGILQEAGAVQTRALAWRELSLPALGEALGAMRKKFQREAEPGLEIVADALSLAAEAAFRSLGIRPYTVQLAGALAMYRGYVAEMATGEGKTLTACLCAVLRGWSGRPCHIITANDCISCAASPSGAWWAKPSRPIASTDTPRTSRIRPPRK
jgi:preprotein translocase subunit SecA